MRKHGFASEQLKGIVESLIASVMKPDRNLMMRYSDEEILSIGQGQLCLNGYDADRSIFLSGPNRKSREGSSLKALALYHVKNEYFGVKVAWPGKENYAKI